MGNTQGVRTGEFGYWLTRYLGGISRYRNYTVIYDHGDKEKESNVAAIKGFYGKQVANVNRLADVDVLVANPAKEALLLIEIEEGNIPPKKLLGDLYAVLFCNRVAVKRLRKQEYFNISPKTRLIISGVVPSRGYGMKKIETVIIPRLQNFQCPMDTIQLENVEFTFGDDLSRTMNKLTLEVKTLFPS